VLEAHRGLKQDPGHEARHGNAIRTDNHLSNLSWGTKRQNRGDQERHRLERRGDPGTWSPPQGEAGILVTLKEAAAAGWLPPIWSDPVKQFSVAKRRATKAGDPVPATRARDGHTIMYDAAELAAFICSVASHVAEFQAQGHDTSIVSPPSRTGAVPDATPRLVTVKDAAQAGMFPATWSKPAAVFRTAKNRAAKSGAEVPEVKAYRGLAALYDPDELARFAEGVAGLRDCEEMRWFSLC
jgi:hypothetical protein